MGHPRADQQRGDAVVTKTLVRDLTGKELDLYASKRGFKPKVGRNVNLWRMDGTWKVWSPGPAVSTWWLLPVDDAAEEVYVAVRSVQGSGAPVVQQALQGAIAVHTKDVKEIR